MTPRLDDRLRAIPLALCLAALASGAGAAAQGALPAQAVEGDEAALFLEIFGEAPPESRPDEALLIAAIDATCPAGLDEAYIKSFARPLRVGERLSAAELDALLGVAADRMSLSNMFYHSSAFYERLEDEAGEDGLVAVRVVLQADEGFWWGFGFYPWDLSVGYRNLRGKGKQARAKIGLGTQELAYLDPSVGYGPLYWMASASHETELRGGGFDPHFLYDEFAIGAELGLAISDDAAIGIAMRCAAFRSPDSYFLYPDYEALDDERLSSLGLTRDFEALASAGLRVRLGSLSYKKRGGLRGHAVLELDALASSAPSSRGAWSPSPRASALACLRYDAPRLLRITLRERITYIGATADGGIPEARWASASDLRCPGGPVSGELASASRLSLGLDRVAAIGLGFTELGFIPEVFYEFGAVARRSRGEALGFRQDVGFVVKSAFAMPVGVTFSVGMAFGLDGESDSSIAFVFEVE
jgi:hypothetical protein